MRVWFTQENTSGLTDADLRVLNRAARRLTPPCRCATRDLLTRLRMAYRVGLSASDLVSIIEQDTP